MLALLPALHAADNDPGLQRQAPQAAPAAPKKPGFFSRLFSSKTRLPDTTDHQRVAALVKPRRQTPQPALISTPLPPSADMDIPVTRSADTTHVSAQPLPLTPSRVIVPPAPSVAPALPTTAPLFAHPVAGKPGCVYPPGLPRIPANIVDVTGMHAGSKARDPITNVIFVVLSLLRLCGQQKLGNNPDYHEQLNNPKALV